MTALIELGIGLTLVYLAGAIVVTAVMESVAGVLRMRAATLRQGLAGLLGNAEIEGRVLAHPLVGALRAAGRRDWRSKLPMMQWVQRAHESPSYIPARSFALALLDVARTLAAPSAATAAVAPATSGPVPAPAPEDGQAPPAPPPGPAATGAESLQEVLRWAGENKETVEVARVIDALRMEAGDDLAKLRTELERWYDEAMDRVSGLYKRWTQWVSGLAGLAVAAVLNLDTIGIAGALWRDPVARAGLADLGDRLSQGGVDAVKYAEILDAVAARGVPIGWPAGLTWAGIGAGLPGWVLTAFALSLGAAFWFDALKRLVNIRSSGPKPGRETGTEGR